MPSSRNADLGRGRKEHTPNPEIFRPEFYRYHTRGVSAGTWELISSNIFVSVAAIDRRLHVELASCRLKAGHL